MANLEETDKIEDEQELFSLEDVTVDTLGLVETGAVGETFFLLKNKGEEMPDSTLEAVNVDDLKGASFVEKLGLQRLKELLKKGQAVEKEDQHEEVSNEEQSSDETEKRLSAGAARGVNALIDEYGEDLPTDVVDMLRELLDRSDDLGDDEPQTEDDEVTTMEDKNTQTEVEEVATQQATAPETVAKVDDPTELLARLEKAEQSNAAILARLEKSEGELVKARTEANQEREARELIVHIEKAREFDTLPIKADELGGFLHSLAKADQMANIEKAADAEDRQDLAGFICGVLKAANEIVKEAGFYNETGTSKTPDELSLIEKAQAAVAKGDYEDLRTALLAIGPEEAGAYLRQFDN